MFVFSNKFKLGASTLAMERNVQMKTARQNCLVIMTLVTGTLIPLCQSDPSAKTPFSRIP